MKTELLLKLADLLDTVEAKKFDYGAWFSGSPETSLDACGTTACALGWATTIPETGLSFAFPGNPGGSLGKNVRVVHGPHRFTDILAAEMAFEIETSIAEALFLPDTWCEVLDEYSPHTSAGPKAVADWIRRVVASVETTRPE